MDNFADEGEYDDDGGGNDEMYDYAGGKQRAYTKMLFVGLGDGRVVGIHCGCLAHNVLSFVKQNIMKVRAEMEHAQYIVQQSTRAAFKTCKSAIAQQTKRVVKEAMEQRKT